MTVCKCDRCGTPIPYTDFACHLTMTLIENCKSNYRSVSIICEQCYQTIKEVLEDGEIK